MSWFYKIYVSFYVVTPDRFFKNLKKIQKCHYRLYKLEVLIVHDYLEYIFNFYNKYSSWVIETTFEPDYIATDHWHAHNTLYFIMDGEMQFGENEPIYKKGDIRVVKAGYSYGPEKPGKDGVKFI